MKARTCEKLGIQSRKVTLPGSIQTAELMEQVRKLNEDDSIDGILIQITSAQTREQARCPRECKSEEGRRWLSFIESRLVAAGSRSPRGVYAVWSHDSSSAFGRKS